MRVVADARIEIEMAMHARLDVAGKRTACEDQASRARVLPHEDNVADGCTNVSNWVPGGKALATC